MGATPDAEQSRAWNAVAAVALFSGEFDQATRAYERAARGALDPASELAAAALSAGYGGDRVRAERLLDRASALPACPSSRAFTLYTTAEPCPMCAALISFTGVSEVVFGVSVQDLIDLGVPQIDLSCDAVVSRGPSAVSVRGGVLREACLEHCRALAEQGTP